MNMPPEQSQRNGSGDSDGHEIEDDTIIGQEPLSANQDELDPDLAEANTIIVSFAQRDFIEFAPETAKATIVVPVHAAFALKIGTHPLISLDVPAYIGRRPSTPRITGIHMPRLVMVPSPTREVSSTHVEIRQEAETVVVTDLGSTNGTRVLVPGLRPRSLRQGESFVAAAGSVVDIGDGIRIEIVSRPDGSPTEGSA